MHSVGEGSAEDYKILDYVFGYRRSSNTTLQTAKDKNECEKLDYRVEKELCNRRFAFVQTQQQLRNLREIIKIVIDRRNETSKEQYFSKAVGRKIINCVLSNELLLG